MTDYFSLMEYRRMNAEMRRLTACVNNHASRKVYVRNRRGRTEYYTEEISDITVRRKRITKEEYDKIIFDQNSYRENARKLKMLKKDISSLTPKIPGFEDNIEQLFLKLRVYNQSPGFINCFKTEGLVYRTKRGDFVRSKGEEDCADALYDNGIAYEYEIYIPEIDVYPDFYIKDSIRGIPVIWEHCGKMSDPEYVRDFIIKLEKYKKIGFVPGYNLILTFEYYDPEKSGNKIVFDSFEAQRVVKEWFLPEGIVRKKKV